MASSASATEWSKATAAKVTAHVNPPKRLETEEPGRGIIRRIFLKGSQREGFLRRKPRSGKATRVVDVKVRAAPAAMETACPQAVRDTRCNVSPLRRAGTPA